MTTRPFHCRERMRDEGRAYPKSSCSACGRGIGTGLGTCPYDVPASAKYMSYPYSAPVDIKGMTFVRSDDTTSTIRVIPRNSYMWTTELHAAFAKLPGNPLPTVDLLNELHQALNGACVPMSDAKQGT